MSWIDRLRSGITLVSPEGNRFEAKWRGNDASLTKRVNRVAHPDLDGETAQDLGVNSWDMPTSLYFDGPDCDIDAQRFSRAVAERGLWNVTHPIVGLRRLMPTKITVGWQPLDSGNVTQVSVDWFEPDPDASALSETSISVAPAAAVNASVSALSESAKADAAQIASKASSSALSAQGALQQLRKGIDAVKGILRSANSRVTAIMGTINNLTLRPYLDIAAIAGAVIQLAESPGLFVGSLASRLSMYAKLGKRIMA
jgi:prophage DNA circulation protein